MKSFSMKIVQERNREHRATQKKIVRKPKQRYTDEELVSLWLLKHKIMTIPDYDNIEGQTSLCRWALS